MKDLKKPELLMPAGNFERARIAFLYGADAVYVGTPELSLRARAELTFEDLKNAVTLAHSLKRKVYTAINIYAWEEDYPTIEEQARELDKINVDGIIVSDGGVLETVKEFAPNTPIHISTQANTISSHSARFWHRNGAKRIIFAREIGKKEIKSIQENIPPDLETEVFIHGAVCYSYSGRCLLSTYMANRDANHGDCAQSCRWQYNVYLEEKKRPGEYMEMIEDAKGTYIMSSKDLCLVRRLPELIELGVDSLKVEGRLKTEYYVATVAHAYRNAIDDYLKNPKDWNHEVYLEELMKTKTRGLSEMFFDGRQNRDIQDFEGEDKAPMTMQYAGIVKEPASSALQAENKAGNQEDSQALCKQQSNGLVTVEIKNRLVVGDQLELLVPHLAKPISFKIDRLVDVETGEDIPHVNPGRVGQAVKMKIPVPVEKNYIMRKKVE